MRPIEIIGGGLAGLSLGLALQRAGVPVTVREAGSYPRPKVCGEFIAGLDDATVQQLHLAPWLSQQRNHRTARWFDQQGPCFVQHLPEPAIGISRHYLDTALAEALRCAGGQVVERQRVDAPAAAGRIFAHGRRRTAGGWLGLKLHVADLPLAADLEMHLGAGAYVGLAGVEDGRVNVCGLFPPRRVKPGPPETILLRHLEAAGLAGLAERVANACSCPDSSATVGGIQFGRWTIDSPDHVAIGDAFAAIPPFTGHGMAMALQSAATAVEPLRAWAQGRAEWRVIAQQIRRRLRHQFALRLTLAQALHPWLLRPERQRLLVGLQARRLLPLNLLYRVLH
jgi:menaquinone-9 beta-reductase